MRIAGLDIGGTNIKFGIVDELPKVQSFAIYKTQHERLVEQLLEIIPKDVEKVGIGLAGLVSNGILYSAPNLPGIYKLNLKEELEKILKIDVKITNDANAVALGEWKYGAGRGAHNLLVLTLGTGIGGGIIINDKLYEGNGFAGEFGHITINTNGPPCGCGNYGCLESYIGSNALIRYAQQFMKLTDNSRLKNYDKITTEVICKEANNGDEVALKVIDLFAYYLGIGIASLINIFSPDKIILCGGVSRCGEILFSKVRKEVNFHSYVKRVKNIEIVASELGDLSGIIGSVIYAIHNNKR